VSRFLVNLARRGAGFPMATVQAPPSSPFGPAIREHKDKFMDTSGSTPDFRVAEEPSIGHTPRPSPLPTTSFEGYRELPEEPAHDVLSIPPLSRAESSTSSHPMVGESALTADMPLREPVPMSQEPMSLDKRKAEGASLKSSNSQTRDGAEKLHEPPQSVRTIQPLLAESHEFIHLVKSTPASSTAPPAQLPVHVRIGRIEIRAATAQTPTSPKPTSASPNPPPTVGFEGYHRVRNYRN
jgi:hypothetical protein